LGASLPEPARIAARTASWFAVALVFTATAAQAQRTGPTLHGRAALGDSVLTAGTVLVHHLATEAQAETDTVRIRPDGTFELRLRRVPDPDLGDVYFGSIRHDGILYFGQAITDASQLDSTYLIRTFDTVSVSAAEGALTIGARNIFLEGEEGLWRVTDLFQILNGGQRTVLAGDRGHVWTYPLPEGASDFSLNQQTEFLPQSAEFVDGAVVLDAPIPPGERVFVFRYTMPDPFIEFPTPGVTGTIDLLVREPAPPVEAEGLTFMERVELEPGTTYVRFNGASVEGPSIRLREAEKPGTPPVKILAVVLALILAGAGLFGVMGMRREPVPAAATTGGSSDMRRDILLQIARLDEDFEASETTTESDRDTYQKRRAELMRRLQSGG
jgi:hypothetical protein